MLNDAFHARYLIYYYALFFTFLLFLQPLFLNGARSQLDVLPQIEEALQEGSAITIQDESIRIRKLPVR